MIGRLPRTLEVGGSEWSIRTDFRDILVIMEAYNDSELSSEEKSTIMMEILFESFDQMPRECWEEAANRAIEFLDCGHEPDDKPSTKKLVDWEQDESILFPAINKVAGKEIRELEYLHWWTFVGYFMEIQDGTFSAVLGIRQKKAKGKKLEKHEQDFYQANKSLCDIKTKYTEEEQAEIDYFKNLLG